MLPLPADPAGLLVSSLATLAAGLYLFDRLMVGWLRTGSLGIY